MATGIRLALGQARQAWREYPSVRRNVRAAEPGPPLLVTGVYRSGTTWIGAMLAAPGVWHVHEPFNPNQGLWDRELAYAPPEREHPGIDRLVGEILAGRHTGVVRLAYAGRWFSPIRILPLRPRRVLIKDPSAALMSAYLAVRHGVDGLVVFRHPAGVVGSFLRMGWSTDRMVARLLEDEELAETRLAPFRTLLEEAATRRDPFSGTVLYGCVNRVLWDFTEEHPSSLRRLAFEDLCDDPLGRFRDLYGRLDLAYDAAVRAAHEALCFSEPNRQGGYPPHEVRRSSAVMGERWKSELFPDELGVIRRTWERFEVPLYRSEREWTLDEPGPVDVERGSGG